MQLTQSSYVSDVRALLSSALGRAEGGRVSEAVGKGGCSPGRPIQGTAPYLTAMLGWKNQLPDWSAGWKYFSRLVNRNLQTPDW